MGAIILDAKIDAATSVPTVNSPSITIGAPNNTTVANTPACILYVQTPKVLVIKRNFRLTSAVTAL